MINNGICEYQNTNLLKKIRYLSNILIFLSMKKSLSFFHILLLLQFYNYNFKIFVVYLSR